MGELQIPRLFLEVVLLTVTFVFLSIYFWSGGYIFIKLKRHELSRDDLPKWLRILEQGTIRRLSDQGVVPYIDMIIGYLVIGTLVAVSIWHWYRYGLDQTDAAFGIALLIWCLIIGWFLRLGR
jgi:hypothetical protein